MKLRIGHLSTFYHTAILLMANDELSSKFDFEPVWTLFPTGPAIVDAFARGELDLAYIGLPPAIIGMDNGVPIKCIAGGHVEGTIIVGRTGARGYPATEDLREILEQYRGQRIGVPGVGTIHDVILRYSLQRHGLADAVEVVPFPQADSIVEALGKGRVAAAFGTPALAVSARRYAGGKLLFPAECLWPNNPSYGIVATESMIAAEPERMVNFLEVHEDATRVIRRTPRVAAGEIARFFKLVDEEFVMDTFRISPKYCAQLSEAYLESTMAFVPVMKDLGFISGRPALGDVFDLSLISRAHGPGSHYRTGISVCGEHHLFHPGTIRFRTPDRKGT